jgi:hypothetical protein
MDRSLHTTALSRRTFLATTGAALVGTVWHGLGPQSEAVQRHAQRRGALNFGSFADTAGLDSHRNNRLYRK